MDLGCRHPSICPPLYLSSCCLPPIPCVKHSSPALPVSLPRHPPKMRHEEYIWFGVTDSEFGHDLVTDVSQVYWLTIHRLTKSRNILERCLLLVSTFNNIKRHASSASNSTSISSIDTRQLNSGNRYKDLVGVWTPKKMGGKVFLII